MTLQTTLNQLLQPDSSLLIDNERNQKHRVYCIEQLNLEVQCYIWVVRLSRTGVPRR